MRFLADMGVSQKVCEWLREQGHDVVHLRDEGLQRLPNGEIFAKAIREARIVLTFDLDFSEIVASAGPEVTSVIVFRLKNTRPLHVIERLRAVLADSAEAIETGAVVSVEESRHRLRRLPLGG
ncbi:MAG: DUF5615 family PIN-like protein [Pirellulales bacterium]|nr:DUF5615 family PIN-like protein [Pirellulales bacterium]